MARLYIGEPSAEAVAAQMPDLILISATGGDSAPALYDQLSAIAPTLIINYDDKAGGTAEAAGTITGQEKQAAERIAAFDKQLAQVKQQMTLPPQPVNAIVYTAAAHSANLWTAESPGPAVAPVRLLPRRTACRAAHIKKSGQTSRHHPVRR